MIVRVFKSEVNIRLPSGLYLLILQSLCFTTIFYGGIQYSSTNVWEKQQHLTTLFGKNTILQGNSEHATDQWLLLHVFKFVLATFWYGNVNGIGCVLERFIIDENEPDTNDVVGCASLYCMLCIRCHCGVNEI